MLRQLIYPKEILTSLHISNKDYSAKYSFEHCFETPTMHVLNDELQKRGLRICFMAEYFLPEYRRNGIASALTSKLAVETMNQGKVPFYCAAWSNIKSVRNALKSGFKPAWVEMTAKSFEFVLEMNS
jgi:hypothetical protein